MDVSKSVNAQFTDLPPTVTSLNVSVDHKTGNARAVFTGNDPGNGTNGLSFQCKRDNQAYQSCSSPKLYKHLGRGQHMLSVTATDSAGNVSTPAVKHFTI